MAIPRYPIAPIHTARSAAPILDQPRRQITTIHAGANTLQVRSDHGPASAEQLLREHRELPAGHPDRIRLRARIIEDHLPMADRLARRYAGRGQPSDDLAQVAAIGLIKAVDNYDPSRRTPFMSYAIPSILGAIKRHFRDTAWAIRVPRSAQELHREIAIATAELSQRQSRPPTSAEVAHHLHVTINDVRTAVGAGQVYHLASLNAAHSSHAGDLIDILGSVDPHYDGVDNQLTLRTLLATLAPRERRILNLRYFGHLTQSQIAAEIGVSQMQVSRLLKKSPAQLRTVIVTGPEQRPDDMSPRPVAVP